MRRARLGTAVAGAIAVGVVLTAALYVIGTRYLIASRWPWDLDPQLDNVQLDTLRLVLSLVAGIGAVVGLVIAYRRQNDLENHRFTEEFTNAARLMASTEIAESVAGVHAMAAAVNGTQDRSRRQQGVDQLCGYLRLSTDPNRDPYLSEALTVRDTVLGSQVTNRQTFKTREADMRRAVISVISAHRQRTKPILSMGKWIDKSLSRFDRTNSWLDCSINLVGADLSYALLPKIDLRNANLSGANLAGAILSFADLTGARLYGARLNDAVLLSADLTKAALTDANLTDANLAGATLTFTDLTDARLNGARLNDATLFIATLHRTELSGANLKGASFEGARLEGVRLRNLDGGDSATWNAGTIWPDGFQPES